ncbi:MAG: lysine--tRNA ligase [Chloroflexi bacterium]|nr:lysine--tRNA ligase [Chloroflexota bacterium]
MADREDTLLKNRAAKLERLRGKGIDPYPARFHRTCDAATATGLFEAVELGEQPEEKLQNISLAGRIVSMRTMGKAAFLDLQDSSGGIQALLRQNNLGEGFDLLKDLDIGDHLGVRGNLIRTRTGEITIEALELTITAKGMRPLPEKWHGLKDVETRYRQRYLDLIANRDEIMPVFALRSKVISGIRRFLDGRGFLEVDTPILVPVAAGAHAKPFVTHHNALDQRLYLRIATELYLKRLIIGGFDKVYEIGRVFRNEGIDQDHNPEFTLLESYEAYADYNDVMVMVEEMISTLAVEVTGSSKVTSGDNVIDFTPPWQRVSLREEIQKRSGIDLESYDDEALRRRAGELGIDTTVLESRGRLIDKLLSAFVEPHLIQPTFVLDYPEEMSPLAKAKPDSPGYVERFEAFACGMEIANSYSELNDPKVQRERFEAQEQIRKLYEDEEVDRQDDDFLTAMEYGMPPTGGLGIGIDRLVMLLAGQTSIRDVLLFPQMRSQSQGDVSTEGDSGETAPE